MRNISFALTTPQFIDGSKDVTRRFGWLFAEDGDLLQAVEKSQGLGKGGKIKSLGLIRLVDVRREPLSRMITEPAYGNLECRREGFPDMTPGDFIEFFCRTHKKCTPETVITRMEFRKLSECS